jgi:phosphonopyruvate decarboxylase
MMTREEAIASILKRHGTEAVYIASTGFVSRAVRAVAGEDYLVFYMQGSMGLAPAIGLGIAISSETEVVVINGDGALLMSLGTTHTASDLALPNFFHYVLDNGCHESVGGQRCAPLDAHYGGVTEVIPIGRGGRPPRVGIQPAENAHAVRTALMRTRVRPGADVKC